MKRKLAFYFLSEFFGSLDFARGLFVLYLLSKGVSMGGVGVLQTLLFWSNIIFEVPAGILADKFKRKYSIALGLILIAGASFLMPFAESFAVFSVVFIFHGMGFAFRSGANNALLYDELKSAGEPWSRRFVELTAKNRSLVNIALVLAMGLGGVLQTAGWSYVYFVFGISMLVAAAFVMAIDESPHTADSETEAKPNVVKMLNEFFKLPGGRKLARFVLGMGFIEALHAPFFIYIQSYFKEAGLPESQVSWVIALSLALTSIAYLFADRLARIQLPRLIGVGTASLVLLVGIFLFSPSLATGIPLFAIIDMIPALIFVQTDNYINEQIPTQIRASLLSFHSLVSSVFISLAFLGAGLMMDSISASVVLGMLALLPLLGFLSMHFYFRETKLVMNEYSSKVEPV